MRDEDIADALSLSQHTVRRGLSHDHPGSHRHVSNIYARVGCATRAAAVAKVRSNLRLGRQHPHDLGIDHREVVIQ
jgi:DNA-binding NarL/FixJ family response regulator